VIESIIYLNPRNEIGYPLVWRLANQDRLQIIILSRDLRTAARKKIPWTNGKREAMKAIKGVEEGTERYSARKGADPAYNRALDEFMTRCVVAYLMAE